MTDKDAVATDGGQGVWEAVWDDESQSTYWWNTVTNETTWDDPTTSQQQDTSDFDTDTPTAAGADGDAGPPGAESASGVSTADQNDYYNSKEYAEWYYGQMAALQGTAGGSYTSGTADSGAAAAYAGYGYVAPTASAYTVEQMDKDYTLSATFNSKTGRFQPDRANAESYFNPNAKAERQMSHFFDVDKYQEERNRMRAQEALLGKPKPKVTKKDLERFRKKNKEKKLRSLLKRFGPDD